MADVKALQLQQLKELGCLLRRPGERRRGTGTKGKEEGRRMMTVRSELANEVGFRVSTFQNKKREERNIYGRKRGKKKLRCVNVQKAVEDSVGVCCKREEEKRREACCRGQMRREEERAKRKCEEKGGAKKDGEGRR